MAIYRLTFILEEGLLDPGNDVMYIFLDDLGGYREKDFCGGTKAVPAGPIIITIQE